MTAPIPARPAGCLCPWEEEDPACPVHARRRAALAALGVTVGDQSADRIRLDPSPENILRAADEIRGMSPLTPDQCAWHVAAIRAINAVAEAYGVSLTEPEPAPTMAGDGVPDPLGMVWRGTDVDGDAIAVTIEDGCPVAWWHKYGEWKREVRYGSALRGALFAALALADTAESAYRNTTAGPSSMALSCPWGCGHTTPAMWDFDWRDGVQLTLCPKCGKAVDFAVTYHARRGGSP